MATQKYIHIPRSGELPSTLTKEAAAKVSLVVLANGVVPGVGEVYKWWGTEFTNELFESPLRKDFPGLVVLYGSDEEGE